MLRDFALAVLDIVLQSQEHLQVVVSESPRCARHTSCDVAFQKDERDGVTRQMCNHGYVGVARLDVLKTHRERIR